MSVLAEQLGGEWNAEGMSGASPTLLVHYLQMPQAACKVSKTCCMRRKQDSRLAQADAVLAGASVARAGAARAGVASCICSRR